MATGYWRINSTTDTNWNLNSNWYSSPTSTTAVAFPNASTNIAYIGNNAMAGGDATLLITSAAVTLNKIVINAQNAVGNLNSATINGGGIQFLTSGGGIEVLAGSPDVTFGQAHRGLSYGISLIPKGSQIFIDNKSSNTLWLHDADFPLSIEAANVEVFFRNWSTGNIFIGKTIQYLPTTGRGLIRTIMNNPYNGGGWTYWGNASPSYEVTTWGNIGLLVERGAKFAFNYNSQRWGNTATFAAGIRLEVGATVDAWYEYYTTSPLTLAPSGYWSGNVDTLTFNGSSPITFAGTATLNHNGTLKFNILGSTFTIAGGIGNGSSPGTAYPTAAHKLGGGILALLGNNSYFTSYTQSAGTTRVANAGSLGTGTVTLNGGTLSTTGGGTSFETSNNNFVINGSVAIGETGYGGWLSVYGTTNISGNSTIITNSELFLENQLQGSATLTKSGASNLWLKNNYGNAAPSFTGQFILNNGALFLGGFNTSTPNQLNNASSIVLNGGHVQVCGNVANTFTNSISGAVDIYFRNTSAGGITFTNSANYTGSPRLYADSAEGATTAQKWTTAHLGFSTFYYLIGGDLGQNITQTIVYNGTTASTQNSALQINAYQANRVLTAVFENASTNNTTVTFNEAVNNYTTNAQPAQTFRFNATSGRIIQNGPIRDLYTGTLNVIKSGSYDVTLNSAGTYRGTTTISQGKLIAGKKTALGTGTLTISSGAQLQCTDTSTDPAKLASVGSFTSNGGRLILG